MEQYKVCVLGGSGFVGAEICRLAVAMGHRVVSVSRGGRPPIDDEPWVEGVEWVESHVLDVDQWSDHLAGAEAVVHCVGIVAEHPEDRQTFAGLHRDSVELAARAAQRAGVPKFVFVSAASLPASLPHPYLQCKLDAEATLQKLDLAVAILRPNRVCAGPPRSAPAGALAAAESPRVDAWSRHTPGLRRERVAMAALRAALQPETMGILEPADIAHLGDAMFIQ